MTRPSTLDVHTLRDLATLSAATISHSLARSPLTARVESSLPIPTFIIIIINQQQQRPFLHHHHLFLHHHHLSIASLHHPINLNPLVPLTTLTSLLLLLTPVYCKVNVHCIIVHSLRMAPLPLRESEREREDPSLLHCIIVHSLRMAPLPLRERGDPSWLHCTLSAAARQGFRRILC